jgi:hypothetical protein
MQLVHAVTGLDGELVLDRSSTEGELLRQVTVDIPRTASSIPLFTHLAIRKLLEHVLCIYALRHPASGYVQGMNDLLVPIVIVLLQGILNSTSTSTSSSFISEEDVLTYDVGSLPVSLVNQLEADCYWSFAKLLEAIQDNYIFSQPGIQRMLYRLEDLVARLDPALYKHLNAQGVLLIQFAFRWMNCLLIRELPLPCVIRLYDTYLACEHLHFADLHVYVCCVLLTMYRVELLAMDFQELLSFLQHLPTGHWAVQEVDSLLAQAYILSHLFDDSPSHLLNSQHLSTADGSNS